MQLLSKSGYSFTEKIDAYNKEHGSTCKFTYESLVKNLYCSSSVKRAIWRTLVIVKDILRITKHAPARFFVEMARDDAEEKKKNKGKRTKSRKDQIYELYDNMKKDNVLISDLKQLLDKYSDDDLRKSKDRLFLYFTQCGKCMYSGEPIDLDSLLGDKNGTIWDIDHIYPQSKVVDNSLDNRVLVKKNLNNIKQDRLPLESGVVTDKAKSLWTFLLNNHLISKEKYERLTRQTPLTAEDLAGFISRQLVETRQATKAVCETLRTVFGGEKTTIVYSHAGRVSEFRNVHTKEGSYEFVKCRDVNDHHHAKDAYLNIVVGNLFHTRFTGDPRKVFTDETVNVQLYTENHTGLLQHEIKRYDPSLKQEIIAWIPKKSLEIVRKQMSTSRILVTRFVHENTSNGGAFYKQCPLKAKTDSDALLPLKTKQKCFADCRKYGGYNAEATAFFILVEYLQNQKLKRAFKPVPTRVGCLLKECCDETDQNNILLNYCRTQMPLGLGLTNPRLIIKKVLIGTRLIFNGFVADISGTDSETTFQIKHGEQLVLSLELTKHIKDISKIVQNDLQVLDSKKVEAYKVLNNKMFDMIIQKLTSPYYSNYDYYSKCAQTLNKKRESFVELDLYSQFKFLLNALKLFSSTTRGADLSILNCGGEVGKMSKSMDITKFKENEIFIVHSSPTGLTKQIIDLKKL